MIRRYSMNSENSDYLLGILKKKKNQLKKKNTSSSNENKTSSNGNGNQNVLIQQLMQIQKNIRNEEKDTEMMEERMNKMKENKKEEDSMKQKSFKNVLLRIVTKLEDDVNTVSSKIQEFNQEKKSIVEMNQKEIHRLKRLVKKLYKTILTIYQSLDVNKNTRTELLQRLKRNIESNKNFLQNIQEINMIRGYVPNKMTNMTPKEEVEMAVAVEPSEEEEMVMANTEIMNQSTPSSNKSNITIFNLIEQNKPKKNQSEEEESTPSPLPQTSEPSESSEPKEMKEKRLNMSKKVSRKLNEMPSISNQQARNSLNQFLKERMGSITPANSTPPSNKPVNSTPPSNKPVNSTPPSNKPVNSTPPSNKPMNQTLTTSLNTNNKKNNNIFI